MRILIVTATYLPTVNGISISIKLQKDALVERGHEVTIVAPQHKNQKREKGVVRLPALPNPKYIDYPIMVPLPYNEAHFKVLGKNYDIVYFHHPFYIGETAILLAKYFGCPSVFFYHTQYDEYAKVFLPKQIPSGLVKKLILNHIKDIASKVDRVIVETVTLKDKLKSMGVKKKISVVVSGRIGMKSSGTSKINLRKKYNLPLKKVTILCVSRLSKEKNISSLIKIAASLKSKKEFTLVFAGDGPEKGNLEKLTQKFKLDNVIFLGNVDYANLPEVYSLSDVFAYPSKTDTQAIVLVEAMSAGLPLLAFNSPGPKDFIINNKNGFLCNDIKEFKISLNKLISNSKTRERMKNQSSLQAMKYSFSVSIDKLEKTLKKTRSNWSDKQN